MNDGEITWCAGDAFTLLEPSDYFVHQLNCIVVRPQGLANAVARRYNYADVYSRRRGENGRRNLAIFEDRSQPGSIDVSRDPEGRAPTIVGLFAQYAMGKANPRQTLQQYGDTILDRELWFAECLAKLRAHCIEHQVKRVVFPGGIGCNLAGGVWPRYVQMIREFARDAPFRVLIVCAETKWLVHSTKK